MDVRSFPLAKRVVRLASCALSMPLEGTMDAPPAGVIEYVIKTTTELGHSYA